MSITSWVTDHPYSTGAIVIIGGIVFITIVRGGGSSAPSGAVSNGPSDAQIAANATIQAAQIGSQGQVALANAQANAAIGVAQIGAGVQLNSDNKAAEVYLKQIEGTREIYQSMLSANRDKTLAAINTIGPFKGKGGYDEQKAAALQTIFSGQNTLIPTRYSQTGTDGNSGSDTNRLIGSIGGAIGSAGSLLTSIFSDARLKENIRFAGFDKNGRELYYFNYKGSTKERIGYIAQSLQTREPELVSSDPITGFFRIPANLQN